MTDSMERTASQLQIDSKLLNRLEQCTNLPSPPVVAMRIIDLSNDPNVDIGKVADVISMDPALTAKIMRISNSPIYALRRKTENLHQAITLLGLNGTLTLALSFSLAASMNNNASQGFNYNAYWHRSLAAATCCRRLGMAISLRKGEELFLAGLLQDIGMLVIDKMDPEFYKTLGVDQHDHVSLAAGEQEKLGADHAAIGGWILMKWGMPEYLVDSIINSHDMQPVPEDDRHQSFVNCISLSGPLADGVNARDERHDIHIVADLIKSRLGVNDDEFDSMMESLNVDLREAEELFETDLSDYSFSDSLLDRAKEALIIKNLESLQKTQKLQATAEMLESKTQLLEEKSRRDGLTGLFNRAYLDECLEKEFAMARDRGWPIIVMFVDLDHFKKVNDTYGHQAGDLVLQRAARALIDGTREEDVVARFGGEEFIVVAPGQGTETAIIMAERLVKMFRDITHVVSGGKEITVTASLGIAVLGDGAEFKSEAEIIAAADKALYVAKESGRNRYAIYSSEMEQQSVAGASSPAA
ncbi:MAG: GGDEF domain-containing protein [Gammaproteobacteria bacterium]|nr:GGDEF domain-containing protein [Gammaproteobacteria bacterium]MDH5513717.1 GGDEF domain-containing protein [Gammaproteobacteria bacterium]